MTFNNIPTSVKESGCFCLWRYEERNGKQTKVPYRIDGSRAKSTVPGDFTSFQEALNALNRGGTYYNGIGLGIFHPWTAIDIDHCIDDQGNLSPMAHDIVKRIDSYTEKSPSGEGIRIILRVDGLEFDKQRFYINNPKKKLEVYIAGATNKYVTLTGNRLQGSEVEERTQALSSVLNDYMRKTEPKNTPTAPTQPIDDEQLLARIQANGDSAEFDRLWRGDRSGYGSDSDLDFAFFAILRKAGAEPEQMERLAWKSGLVRDKWKRADYIARTIQNVMAKVAPVEAPKLPSVTSLKDFFPQFLADVQQSKDGSSIWATGIPALDCHLAGGFRSKAISVIGAISSCGKSALALQIASNIAKQKRKVIYFALEMTTGECFARLISRESALFNIEKDRALENMNESAFTQSEILHDSKFSKEYGSPVWREFIPGQKRILETAQSRVLEYAENLSIVEGRIGGMNAQDIRQIVAQYVTDTGIIPFVVVDYLQLLSPFERGDIEKQTLDKNVYELKKMAQNLNLPVLLISSFNRASYKKSELENSSFSGSSGIEYTCDVTLGLDFRARGDSGFMESVEKCKIVRELRLECAKNRAGETGWRIDLDYCAKYHTFVERQIKTESRS